MKIGDYTIRRVIVLIDWERSFVACASHLSFNFILIITEMFNLKTQKFRVFRMQFSHHWLSWVYAFNIILIFLSPSEWKFSSAFSVQKSAHLIYQYLSLFNPCKIFLVLALFIWLLFFYFFVYLSFDLSVSSLWYRKSIPHFSWVKIIVYTFST